MGVEPIYKLCGCLHLRELRPSVEPESKENSNDGLGKQPQEDLHPKHSF